MTLRGIEMKYKTRSELLKETIEQKARLVLLEKRLLEVLLENRELRERLAKNECNIWTS